VPWIHVPQDVLVIRISRGPSHKLMLIIFVNLFNKQICVMLILKSSKVASTTFQFFSPGPCTRSATGVVEG
jgi:hypothetical protein